MKHARIVLRFETFVAAEPAEVWKRVSTMRGVNAEMMPMFRMTYPAHMASLEHAPQELLGKLAFKSWVCLLGLLPVDRHFLCLERVMPGVGFDERSWSWSQRLWIHRRRLERTPGGTGVVDELEFEPRFALAAPFLRWLVTRTFAHRHWRLQAHFGRADG
jgi:hypothetical protein